MFNVLQGMADLVPLGAVLTAPRREEPRPCFPTKHAAIKLCTLCTAAPQDEFVNAYRGMREMPTARIKSQTALKQMQ